MLIDPTPYPKRLVFQRVLQALFRNRTDGTQLLSHVGMAIDDSPFRTLHVPTDLREPPVRRLAYALASTGRER